MKKTYKKPEVLFESFSMSTNIAGDCEQFVGAARGNCTLPSDYGLLKIFISAETGCDLTEGIVFTPEGDDGTYNGYCYHVPSNGPNWFVS